MAGPQPLTVISPDALFEPYATEIGYLLRDWNEFQEKLADLFGTVLGDNTGVSRPIWYVVRNDRLQREMLKVAAMHAFDPALSPDHELIRDEILWILEKASSLGPQRDAAAHAPLSLLIGDPLEFIARHFHGNPSATALRGKKLLGEFRLYRARAKVLLGHALAIDHSLRMGQARPPWPKRPDWPTSLPFQEPKSRNQPVKGPRPQRRSSAGTGRPRSKE